MKFRYLKSRILLSFLAVILILGVSIFALGCYVIKEDIYDRAQHQVNRYLDSARTVYAGEIERIGTAFSMVNFKEDLSSLQEKIKLDYLYRISVQQAAGSPSEIVKKCLEKLEPVGGTRIIGKAELFQMPAQLQERCRIPILSTPKARPSSLVHLESAMAKECAIPLKDEQGRVAEIIYGGRLINRDTYLVDRIRDLVFGHELYEGKPVGTVTVFQDDVRITTNVLNENGQRAIGTRISEDVYKKVVEGGFRWPDRAFVVNEWYLAAYEPIYNVNGTIIGVLYVGIQEKPFNRMAFHILIAFVTVVVLASLLATGIAIWLAGSVGRPLTHLIDATKKLSLGELGHEVDTQGTILELNQLAESFNEMSIKLEQRENALKVTNEKLAELNKSYMDLLGFVAHELKGLLSSAIMNAYSIRDGFLGMINFKQKKAIDSICRNLDYLAATVRKFLNLSRIERGNLDINRTQFSLWADVFEPSVQTFSKMISDKKMTLQVQMDPEIRVSADLDLMQIVANNLVNNAAKYGSENGKIVIAAAVADKKVRVEVYNDGRPITAEQKSVLFKKFSRLDVPEKKKVKGTGLGLYITRQIIEAHGGRIDVEPREQGNAFVFDIERV